MSEREPRTHGSGEQGSGTLPGGKEHSASGTGGSDGRGSHQGGKSQTVWMDPKVVYDVPR
jgi:hypothetical protein